MKDEALVTQLLILEMKRAVEILENDERDNPFNYTWQQPQQASEIRQLMKQVRRHSVQLEKAGKGRYGQ